MPKSTFVNEEWQLESVAAFSNARGFLSSSKSSCFSNLKLLVKILSLFISSYFCLLVVAHMSGNYFNNWLKLLNCPNETMVFFCVHPLYLTHPLLFALRDVCIVVASGSWGWPEKSNVWLYIVFFDNVFYESHPPDSCLNVCAKNEISCNGAICSKKLTCLSIFLSFERI